ncbi:FxSxx-COOH cyclophane-containing RiPP peptide [Streptomyces sp. NPDC101152]|jgi:FXSXX-COOH protein|uniref:FxSxx-COOH cyclophane-containing RiPP peptide n=1 Tax=Streptomyces sp. NPDC101152 TaxID=3366116 RepID=UPI0037FB7C18
MKDPNDSAVAVDDATAGTGRLVDLSGVDLAALRGLDHPVLAEVIEDLLVRVTDPAGVLAEYDQKAG